MREKSEKDPRENWEKRTEVLQDMIDTDEISDEANDFLTRMRKFLDENDPSTILEIQYIAIRLATIKNNDPVGFNLLINASKVIAFRNNKIVRIKEEH
jgi:hypothetical protein